MTHKHPSIIGKCYRLRNILFHAFLRIIYPKCHFLSKALLLTRHVTKLELPSFLKNFKSRDENSTTVKTFHKKFCFYEFYVKTKWNSLKTWPITKIWFWLKFSLNGKQLLVRRSKVIGEIKRMFNYLKVCIRIPFSQNLTQINIWENLVSASAFRVQQQYRNSIIIL